MSKFLRKYLKNKFIITCLILVALVVIYVWYKSAHAAPSFQSTEAKIGDVIETVSVTGTISAKDKADLAFEKSGVLSRVYVHVGDHVAKGALIAVLDVGNERAALLSAEATLADMERSLTPEELAVEKSSLDSVAATLSNAKKDALDSADEARVNTEGALVNYTDRFFAYPQGVNPTINISTDSDQIASNINAERVAVSLELDKWASDISSATADGADDLIAKSRTHLSVIRNFMSDLALIVNKLTVGSAGISSAQLDAYKATMNSGFTALNSAIGVVESARSTLSGAKTSYDKAQSSYNLKVVGNSSESIAAQSARVAQAQASVNQGVIISPIDGVITKADPKEGEFVAAGSASFAVQNDNFKIEAFVPEADIAKIALDNTASSTLDAYGADVNFPAHVVSIDPAETVLEGVPTYKVTLEFDAPDSRIRSGMTANLTILTHKVSGVLLIPYRAVTDENGAKSVKIVNPDDKTFATTNVMTGLKGSDGNIQILSGLHAGDKVVTYTKQ